nr:immunoglobulin light chain junction region [Macaca mulatta]MOV93312.1 immunoglobulin light chain junction region [Macaca mulatta]MOV93690.1 immunoglobulin light chain junction region [Macaca mulatta]
CQQHHGRPLTF